MFGLETLITREILKCSRKPGAQFLKLMVISEIFKRFGPADNKLRWDLVLMEMA